MRGGQPVINLTRAIQDRWQCVSYRPDFQLFLRVLSRSERHILKSALRDQWRQKPQSGLACRPDSLLSLERTGSARLHLSDSVRNNRTAGPGRLKVYFKIFRSFLRDR